MWTRQGLVASGPDARAGGRRRLGALFVGLLACSPSPTIGPLSPPDPTSDHPVGVDPKHERVRDRLEPLVDRLTAVMDEHQVPGFALAVVRADELLLARGFGVEARGSEVPVTAESRFAIGTATQAFTATLAAMLVERGKLAWDAPLGPRLRHGDPPRLREALGHVSGFTDMPLLWRSGVVSGAELLELAARAEPFARPGERFLESTVMMVAAGDAEARAAGQPWTGLLQERLFDPLAMTGSASDATPVVAARGVVSTVIDLSRFLRFQLGRGELDGQRWIGAEALAETHAQGIAMAADRGYALGWFVERWQGTTVLRQRGGSEAAIVSLAFIPEDDLGVVILANAHDAALEDRVHELAFRVLLGKDDSEDDAGTTESQSLVPWVDPEGAIDPRIQALQRKRGAFALERKLAKPGLWRATGTVRLPESALSGTYELVFDDRGHMAETADFGRFGSITRVIAENRAWTSFGHPATEAPSGTFPEIRLGHPLVFLRDWTQTFASAGFEPPDRETPSGHVVVGLRAHEVPTARVTVDASTGDIHTIVRTQGGATITTTLAQYRNAAGLRFPFHTDARDPVVGRTVIDLESLTQLAGLAEEPWTDSRPNEPRP